MQGLEKPQESRQNPKGAIGTWRESSVKGADGQELKFSMEGCSQTLAIPQIGNPAKRYPALNLFPPPISSQVA